MLCDGDEDGLVVRGGVDGGEAVDTRGEAAGDVGGEDAVDGNSIHSLEEGEVGGVGGCGLGEGVEFLDNNVGVAD